MIETSTAVWLALIIGLVVLGVQGFWFARLERLGWLATLGLIAINLTLGLALVLMKILLVH